MKRKLTEAWARWKKYQGMLRHLEISNSRKLQSKDKEEMVSPETSESGAVKEMSPGGTSGYGGMHPQPGPWSKVGRKGKRKNSTSFSLPSTSAGVSYWKNLIRAMWQVTQSLGFSCSIENAWEVKNGWKSGKGSYLGGAAKKNLSVEVACQIRLRSSPLCKEPLEEYSSRRRSEHTPLPCPLLCTLDSVQILHEEHIEHRPRQSKWASS